MKVDLNEIFNKGGKLEERPTNALLKALVKAHSASEFEYLKFKQSVETLSGLNMDKATAFKSAFATAATMGLTKEKLMKSVEQYLAVLSNESISFSNALQNQIDKHINSKESTVGQIEDRIKENKLKIEELQNEIKLLEQKMDNVDDDIEAAQVNINGTKDNFKNSYLTITEIMKSDLEDIKQFL